MNSDIIVISWWSNCLGLKCLHNLCQYTSKRNLFVIQAGKPDNSMKAFRNLLPAGVTEFILPKQSTGEHWDICEWAAKKKLAQSAGVWFFDHDLMIEDNCDSWLSKMDSIFTDKRIALAYSMQNENYAITNPAFWISPTLIPDNAPKFSPIPPMKNFAAQRPWEQKQNDLKLKRPEKDTMVACMEYLRTLNMVTTFSMSSDTNDQIKFPSFSHPGGLYLLSYLDIPEFLYPDLNRLVYNLKGILETCPQKWVDIEDPVLMQRIHEREKAFPLKDSLYE